MRLDVYVPQVLFPLFSHMYISAFQSNVGLCLKPILTYAPLVKCLPDTLYCMLIISALVKKISSRGSV